MKVGQRIKHPTYGEGTIIAIEDSIRLGDNKTWPRESQSSITRSTNGWSRYTGNINVAIKFDNGGPQGFAFDSTNEINGEIELEFLRQALERAVDAVMTDVEETL